jgi:hypothetical protein
MLVGLLSLVVAFSKTVSREKILALVLSAIILVGLVGLALLEPLLAEATGFEVFLDLAYPILDIVLIVPCILIILVFKGGVMEMSWFWIALGIAFTMIADVLFSYGTLAGWYYSGNPVELPYLWGYISMGIGFQEQRTEIERIFE